MVIHFVHAQGNHFRVALVEFLAKLSNATQFGLNNTHGHRKTNTSMKQTADTHVSANKKRTRLCAVQRASGCGWGCDSRCFGWRIVGVSAVACPLTVHTGVKSRGWLNSTAQLPSPDNNTHSACAAPGTKPTSKHE
jgi:hypothetical protein